MKLTAITLDLDDTLWPIAPVMERADLALQSWLQQNCPEVVEVLPIVAMRRLRDKVFAQHPELGHDFTALRMICLREALLPHGYGEREVEQAYEAFYAARNCVELYPEVGDALERLARRAPLVSLTNGNACLDRVGLAHLFRAQITARGFGAAKPDPAIFHAACALAGSTPGETLHVGDHPEQDVLGALGAGLHAAWIDREGLGWTLGGTPPRAFSCLARVADFVEGL
ncbi:MAG TPA: HAD family hydrolase [Xanthomonadales bacterium]|nr:HAD family hydrolase [Xanthomonadales bacterium]